MAVRDYIKEKIGEEHLFPVYGVWDSFDEIDFDSLPESFVLKCNHDSGSYKIIKNKSKLTEKDFIKLRAHFRKCLKSKPFYAGREYPYKNVRPKLLAEKFMVREDGGEISDYKFFCFDGEPKLMLYISDCQTNKHEDYYDMDFNHIDSLNVHEQSGITVEKPTHFDEMKEIASKLSAGMTLVRIDLYEINRTVYFGEFTFFPDGGFWVLKPEEWEDKLGEMIKIHLSRF